jgi:trehalose utilization protein
MRNCIFLLCCPLFAADVLIVADEIPAMEVLATHLQKGAGAKTTIVKQDAIPADVSGYGALVVYIHKDIGAPAEKAFIDYAKSGGKLILLHHSISSGKRKNRDWLPFLGVTLPLGEETQGGYKYYEPATIDVVNLAPGHYITTHEIRYPQKVRYQDRELDGFTLAGSEVYLNHVHDTPKTVLLGLKYTNPAGKVYMQPTAGWLEKKGKGTVMYFMAGHEMSDFENPFYSRIVTNAVASR